MTMLNEPILTDDYPMYHGYSYVIDGDASSVSLVADIMTVGDAKKRFGWGEVRRCDLVGRQKQNLSDEFPLSPHQPKKDDPVKKSIPWYNTKARRPRSSNKIKKIKP